LPKSNNLIINNNNNKLTQNKNYQRICSRHSIEVIDLNMVWSVREGESLVFDLVTLSAFFGDGEDNRKARRAEAAAAVAAAVRLNPV
jgi:hypothetical protein